jgi:two-component system, sensor histidine kinase RegB
MSNCLRLACKPPRRAHDLATPMSSVRITLDELRRDYAGDDELDQPLELLAGQVARMQAVLDRLGDSRAVAVTKSARRSALKSGWRGRWNAGD